MKSSIACGLAGAHAMVLVLTLEGLMKLEMEGGLVLQEFVNHGGVVHKVYVAGAKVSISLQIFLGLAFFSYSNHSLCRNELQCHQSSEFGQTGLKKLESPELSHI